MYTENVISKEELIEYRTLIDNKIKEAYIKKTQVNESLQECSNEDYAVQIGKKLKDVLTLKDLYTEYPAFPR